MACSTERFVGTCSDVLSRFVSQGVVMATRTKPGMRHETNMNVYMDDETDDTN